MGTGGAGRGGGGVAAGVVQEVLSDPEFFTERQIEGTIQRIERFLDRLRRDVRRATGVDSLSASNIQRALESQRTNENLRGIQEDIAVSVENLGDWTAGVVARRSAARTLADDMRRQLPRSVMDRGFERRNMAEGAAKIAKGAKMAAKAVTGLRQALARKRG